MNSYHLKELISKWLAFSCTTNLLACPLETGKFCPFDSKRCKDIEPGDWNNLLKLLYNDSEQKEKNNEGE